MEVKCAYGNENRKRDAARLFPATVLAAFKNQKAFQDELARDKEYKGLRAKKSNGVEISSVLEGADMNLYLVCNATRCAYRRLVGRCEAEPAMGIPENLRLIARKALPELKI